ASEKRSFNIDSLYMPDMNIRLGARYLSRMLYAFKGHFPLSLAAYNAGIGRMRKWLALRPETANLISEQSSNPMNEIWMDEMPWDETNDYVKSVLRNYLVNQLLENGEMALTDPIWVTASK
ncbi:MAG: transglycosylase SLT domain-containing protein, partial [Bdellovibrionales bacterium]|nr:transglycosylase SLT domain-containing protein [Bdellovibrionales bacterium]